MERPNPARADHALFRETHRASERKVVAVALRTRRLHAPTLSQHPPDRHSMEVWDVPYEGMERGRSRWAVYPSVGRASLRSRYGRLGGSPVALGVQAASVTNSLPSLHTR